MWFKFQELTANIVRVMQIFVIGPFLWVGVKEGTRAFCQISLKLFNLKTLNFNSIYC